MKNVEAIKIENEVTVIEKDDYFYFKTAEDEYWICFYSEEAEGFVKAENFAEEDLIEHIRKLKNRKSLLEIQLNNINKELKSG